MIRPSTKNGRAQFVTLVLFCVPLILGGPRTAIALEEWSLDKQKNGIKVYTRPIEGSGIKEFKGVAVVDASIEEVVSLLRDSDRFKTWFPNTTESRLLSRDGEVSYRYSVTSAPWPVANRDNVLRSAWKRNAETGVIDITIEAVPDYHPIQDGLVRIPEAHGTWKLEPLGDEMTNVTFTMHLELGGVIPQWLINARIVATPYEALTNFRAILAGPSPVGN